MLRNTIKQYTDLEKLIFFKRCIKKGVILPQNDRKNLDLDLILIHQERILIKPMKKILSEYRNFKNKYWHKLCYKEKQKLIKDRQKEKIRLQQKFDWLWNKQKDRRKALPRVNFHIKIKPSYKQKIKNRKDRDRYKKRRELEKKSKPVR